MSEDWFVCDNSRSIVCPSRGEYVHIDNSFVVPDNENLWACSELCKNELLEDHSPVDQPEG